MQYVKTPVQAIKSARELFIFACFLFDAINQRLITPKSFRDHIRIAEGGHGLEFKGTLTDEQLRTHGLNMVLMALGTTAIATNKAMEAVFGPIQPTDASQDGTARVILYQIRCAFAHDPLVPVWTPRVETYNRTYQVTVQVKRESGETIPRKIEFHPPTLRNKMLKFDDFGGLGGYMGLLDYVFDRISEHPKGNQPYPRPTEEAEL